MQNPSYFTNRAFKFYNNPFSTLLQREDLSANCSEFQITYFSYSPVSMRSLFNLLKANKVNSCASECTTLHMTNTQIYTNTH